MARTKKGSPATLADMRRKTKTFPMQRPCSHEHHHHPLCHDRYRYGWLSPAKAACHESM